MKLVRIGVCAVLVAGAATVPASASAALKLTLHPARPTVHDSTIVVSFVVKKQLPKHHHYTSILMISGDGFCPVMDGADLNDRPAKGRTVRLSYSSHDDPLNPGPAWCAGRAEISVASLTNGDKTTDTGTLLGYKDFTVRARR